MEDGPARDFAGCEPERLDIRLRFEYREAGVKELLYAGVSVLKAGCARYMLPRFPPPKNTLSLNSEYDRLWPRTIPQKIPTKSLTPEFFACIFTKY